MPRFRKRSLTVEALQWTGDNLEDIRRFTDDAADLDESTGELEIATLEGIMCAKIGDWVIKGVHGEFYACDGAVFSDSYDAVADGGQVDPLSVPCGSCLVAAGEPCYSPTSDLPRAEPHRLRWMAAVKGLKPCPTCNKAGWVPVEDGQ